MNSPAAFNSDLSSKIPDVADVTTSLRTTRADYKQLRTRAFAVLGDYAIPWALKYALQGIKLKQGDFVTLKGNKQTDEDFIKKISDPKTNPGYVAKSGGGIAKVSDKSVLSVKRLVRCMASNITTLIAKGYGDGSDILLIGPKVGLDKRYSFIDSVYGMDDDTLKANAVNYVRFCAAFDEIIASAHSAGYCEGSQKQSHAEAAKKYIAFRGFEIASK